MNSVFQHESVARPRDCLRFERAVACFVFTVIPSRGMEKRDVEMSQMPPMPDGRLQYRVPQQGIWHLGDQLMMHRYATLPDRCVKCNQDADGGRAKRRLTWHHPLLYLIIPVNVLVYIIVASCVQETARIEIPLCRRHRAWRNMAIAIGWASAFAATALFIVGVSFENGVLLISGVPVLFGGTFFGVLASRMVWPARIDREYVWLKGVGREYLEMFPPAPALHAPVYPQYPQVAMHGQPMYAPAVMPQRAIPIAPPPLPPGGGM